MIAGQLGDFFSRGNVEAFLKQHLSFAQDHQARDMAASLHLSFEDATHTLGLQEMDEVRWIVSPGTLLLSGLPGDPNYPYGWAQSVGIYASAFIRPRQDNHLVVYSKSHELPVHLQIDKREPRIDHWGTTQGLLLGILHALTSLGYDLQGFDGFIDSPMEPGSGFSTSAVFSSLMIQSLLGGSGEQTYKDLNNLILVTDAYVRAEKDFFGAKTSQLPLLTSLLGGSVLTSSSGIQKIDNSHCKDIQNSNIPCMFYVQNLPMPQELELFDSTENRITLSLSDRKKSIPNQESQTNPELQVYLDRIIQSRKSWNLKRENHAYVRALREIQAKIFGSKSVCLPYASSARELRQLLTVFSDTLGFIESTSLFESPYFRNYPGKILISEDQGTRDLIIN